MAATLATMIDRVEVLLVDSTNLIYDTALITEGIRLAVGEYSLAGEVAVTLNGLDGAGATTIPLIHESLVAVGAAGYTVTARAVDRTDAFSEGGESADLKAWGDTRLKEYRAGLGFIFPGYLAVLASSSTSGDDPALVAAQVALLTAQALLTGAQEDKTTAELALVTAQVTLAGAQATLAGAQSGLLGTQQTKAAAEALLVAAQEAKVTAEVALVGAQASLVDAQAAELVGRESRAAAAVVAAAAEKAAEAARKAELRASENSAWGTWEDE